MAGLFDDLIPTTGGDKVSSLSFDDLIAPKAAPKPKAGPVIDRSGPIGQVTGFMSKVNRGLAIGDELKAGLAVGEGLMTGRHRLGFDKPGNPIVNNAEMLRDAFKNELAGQRQTEDAYQAEHPHMAALATGTGNAMTMAAPVGPGAQAFATGGRMINAARGATVAAATGAAYAAVDRGTPAERLRAASEATHDPVTLGLGAMTGGAVGRSQPKAKPAPVPTLEQLTTDKDAAYASVRKSGERYSAEDFNGLMEDMAHKMDAEGFSAGSHQKAAAKLEAIGQSQRASDGYSPTLEQLDDLRHQIGRDVASSPDPGERRMGAIMRGEIDKFIEAKGGSPDLLLARDLNTRVEKLKSLDQLDEAASDRAAASGSGGNINNATRQNVIRFKNDTGNLKPDERALVQRTIDGTPAGNALRQIGKLSPEGNGLGLTIHTVGAFGSHGATLPVAIGGFVAKKVSDAMTAHNVQALRELIATGGEAATEVSRQLADPQYAELRAQLANDLAVQAGVQGTGQRRLMTGAR